MCTTSACFFLEVAFSLVSLESWSRHVHPPPPAPATPAAARLNVADSPGGREEARADAVRPSRFRTPTQAL